MKFLGKVKKDKKTGLWEVWMPMFDIATFGKSRKDALVMAADAIEEHIERDEFKVNAEYFEDDLFIIESNDDKVLLGFMIYRLRVASGLSQLELAHKLGHKSCTTIARYEQYAQKPKQERIEEILKATDTKIMMIAG